MIRMDINSSEKVKTSENLTNNKPWFNGNKKFSSVKVNPARLEDNPPDLGICVSEVIEAKSIFGGK